MAAIKTDELRDWIAYLRVLADRGERGEAIIPVLRAWADLAEAKIISTERTDAH